MPLQVDHAVPIRTVDTHGTIIATDTNRASPMKTVDSIGRAVQADAQRVAEQAAAANPEIPKEAAPANGAEKVAEAREGEGGEEKLTPAQIRKEYLEAQKERRKAFEMLKNAKEKVARADAVEKARALAESGEDPTELLKSAGLNPVKYYQDLTKYALSDKGKAVENPVERQLREHKERLDQYQKDLEVQTKTLQEKEDLAAHNQAIRDKVIPLLQTNPEKYEALITEYGPNAAVEVYRTVWDIYQQTGKTRSFSEVADEMETYWTEKIDEGIRAAAKLKKFSNRFAQNGEGNRNTNADLVETPRRSVTLSNRPSAPVPSASVAVRKQLLTRDERVAEILKRFPD